MTPLESALELASRGFHVFPCKVNGKTPVHEGWQAEATCDPEKVKALWKKKAYNVGIFTGRFGTNKALVAVDVDVKKGKRGYETLLEVELSGYDFPSSCEHETPSGGRHIIYLCDVPLRQGTDVLGVGLDIRSRGGYLVAPGSVVDGKAYQRIEDRSCMVPAPDWLAARLGVDSRPSPVDRTPVPGVDMERAKERAKEFLRTAPPAIEGRGGDELTFKTIARVKDFGVGQIDALFLVDEWNDRCLPPWSFDDLATKAENVYRYGRDSQGSAAPEAVFPLESTPEEAEEESLHPFDVINKEYAFIKRGAFIVQETSDEKGRYCLETLSTVEFNAWFANVPFTRGNQKPVPVSKAWLESSRRRQYDGLVFMPGQTPGPRWFNLWRGFSVQPVPVANHPALDQFLEHTLKNVCHGNETHFRWLMGYFAHMIQKPYEKPLVALVFHGKKGVGKNTLIERIGQLFSNHFMVADDDRYLTGNFNSHLESCLCLVLDEAAWAGDKKATGRMNGIITGTKHNIERKGQEPFKVDNLTRVVILGNENWLVPATADERRYAVFHVGEGRRQDRKFFESMRRGMESGGYAHLLRYLMDFDLTGIDVNDAPKTDALAQQKLAGASLVQQWWLDCLTMGKVEGGDFGGEWPEYMPTNKLLDAYKRWSASRCGKVWHDTYLSFNASIREMSPRYLATAKIPTKQQMSGGKTYGFRFPGLGVLREDMEAFFGGGIPWES